MPENLSLEESDAAEEPGSFVKKLILWYYCTHQVLVYRADDLGCRHHVPLEINFLLEEWVSVAHVLLPLL